jgi:hypothetical protein
MNYRTGRNKTPTRQEENKNRRQKSIKYIIMTVTEADKALAIKHTINDGEYNAFLTACALKNEEKEEEAIEFMKCIYNYSEETLKNFYKEFKQQENDQQ